MKALREATVATSNPPSILFVYQGSVADGEAYFERLWPEARAVSDPKMQLYRAFGLQRASLRQIFDPEVAACALRAAKNGSLGGLPKGDTRMMPGAFLVVGHEVKWSHQYRHIADHPDFDKIAAIAKESRQEVELA